MAGTVGLHCYGNQSGGGWKGKLLLFFCLSCVARLHYLKMLCFVIYTQIFSSIKWFFQHWNLIYLGRHFILAI